MTLTIHRMPFVLLLAMWCLLAAGCQSNRGDVSADDPGVAWELRRANAMGVTVTDVTVMSDIVRKADKVLTIVESPKRPAGFDFEQFYKYNNRWTPADHQKLRAIRDRQLTAAEPALLAAARHNLDRSEEVPVDAWFAESDLKHPTAVAVLKVNKQAVGKAFRLREKQRQAQEARNAQDKQAVDAFMDAIGLQTPQRREELKAAGHCPDCVGRGTVIVTKPVQETCGSCGGRIGGCFSCGSTGRQTVQQYVGTRKCGTCNGSGKYGK